MPQPRVWFLALCALPVSVASAQVGHDPSRSPYRDLVHGSLLVPQATAFRGAGGVLGIVPHNGQLFGFRAEIGANRPVQIGLEFATGTLERLIVDADDPVATRVTGPVDQKLTLAGLNVMLNLTGAKTWRGLSPYVGGGAGVGFSPRVAADTSGWNYGRRFYFAPTVGVRVFLTRSVLLRAEARTHFAQVRYPESYREEPSKDPGTNDAPNAVLASGRIKEWVTSGVYTVGIGFPFPWPF